MRIAIVHFHLRRGGVSTVIQHALAGAERQGFSVAVITGQAPEAESLLQKHVRTFPELSYSEATSVASASELADRIIRETSLLLGGAPDVWHFHNHALGKNLSMPRLVRELSARGCRLLLQLHDFAEDGRPENYRFLLTELVSGTVDRLGQALYPCATHVHYAVLNERDRGFLQQAGVPAASLHFLPNAIALADSREADENDHSSSCQNGRLFVYPTRAIRRKNIGEFLLWSALAAPGDRFAVTLAPLNPLSRPIYDRWVEFARQLGLPVQFEAGHAAPLSLPALLQESTAAVTTSVAEGFGLAFLEPWLVGCPLLGRRLPEVTRQFEDHGVDLSALYDELKVPVDWLGAERVRTVFTGAWRTFMMSYGRESTPHQEQRLIAGLMNDGQVDFGRLNEEMQETIITRLTRDRGAANFLKPQFLGAVPKREVIAGNRNFVRERYSLEAYGQRLCSLYEEIAGSPAGEVDSLSSAILLKCFLSPERFNLLRTS